MSDERESNLEIDSPATLQTRRRYLRALAIALGCDEQTAEQGTDRILAMKHTLASIDNSKDRGEANPKTISTIESVGMWFLEGSEQQEQLKYTVGSHVLNLLRENPKSGYFTNLRSWVDYWTDGAGGKTFQKLIEE